MTQPVPSTPYGGAVVEPTPNEEAMEQQQDTPSGVAAPITPITGDSTNSPGMNLPTQPPKEPVDAGDGVKISSSGASQQPAPNTAPPQTDTKAESAAASEASAKPGAEAQKPATETKPTQTTTGAQPTQK